MVKNYGRFMHKLNSYWENSRTRINSEKLLPKVFEHKNILNRIVQTNPEPERRPYGSNLLDL